MKSVVIIPARYKSTRFPGKPLVPLLGKPMILWVAELSSEAVGKENVYIATDDKRITDSVVKAGFQAVLTNGQALTGTDRIAEAAEQIEADIYLNVQGDEPLINAKDICRIRDEKILHPHLIINGYCWLTPNEDSENANIPKVITTENNRLVYMSRRPLPGFKEKKNAPVAFKKQVCIYALSRDELFEFRAFGRKSILERSEDIEILRFLEFGKTILMVETKGGSLAVDVPEDIHNVENALKGIKK